MNSESAERQAKVNPLPASVVERTRKQLQDYLGTADFKGVPLLDPTVDWDAQSNWPHQFTHQGRSYRLEITDLSGEEIRTFRSKTEVRPGMTVLFGYEPLTRGPNPAGTNGVFPRASWSKDCNRASGKVLIWGDKNLACGRKCSRTIFILRAVCTSFIGRLEIPMKASGRFLIEPESWLDWSLPRRTSGTARK